MNQQQHGDVNVWAIDAIPEGSKKMKTDIVREGEATGHAHRIKGTDFELLKLGSRILARILSDDCSVVHDEHKEQLLSPGLYEFGPTYEYDYSTEEAKEVRD